MKGRIDPVRVLPPLLAPLAAVAIAVLVSTLVLALGDKPILPTFEAMGEYGAQPYVMTAILNKATVFYLSAVAAAIGFRMALFNIGVDGQYRLAALIAAALGGASFMSWLPGPLLIVLIVIVAMLVGGAWAAIAGLLKVTRGVSEVISTIMLNFIAGSIVAFLLTTDHLGVRPEGSNQVSTRLLPEGARIPGIPLIAGTDDEVYGFIIVAALVGGAYWFMIERTRFGFDLRASGLNPPAAVASGVDAKRMVVLTMALSGAVAGLVGMPQLFGESYAVTGDIGGLGFTGIAIALLGRNHPIGMMFGAVLWGFLDRSAQVLDLNEIPKDTVTIMQGTTVLAVVVAYELTARLTNRIQQKRVGESTGLAATPDGQALAAAAVSAGSPGRGPSKSTEGTEGEERS
jgi:general nucleoside transport system permease protein